MKRRSVFTVLTLAAAGLILPVLAATKEATVTLEISGMT
jgi:hypothetical protein